MIKTILKQKQYRFFQTNIHIPLIYMENPVPQGFTKFTLKNITLNLSFPFKYNDKTTMKIFELTINSLKKDFKGGLLHLETAQSTLNSTYYNDKLDYFLQTLPDKYFNENHIGYPSVTLFYKDEKLFADTTLSIEQFIIKKIILESTKKIFLAANVDLESITEITKGYPLNKLIISIKCDFKCFII